MLFAFKDNITLIINFCIYIPNLKLFDLRILSKFITI